MKMVSLAIIKVYCEIKNIKHAYLKKGLTRNLSCAYSLTSLNNNCIRLLRWPAQLSSTRAILTHIGKILLYTTLFSSGSTWSSVILNIAENIKFKKLSLKGNSKHNFNYRRISSLNVFHWTTFSIFNSFLSPRKTYFSSKNYRVKNLIYILRLKTVDIAILNHFSFSPSIQPITTPDKQTKLLPLAKTACAGIPPDLVMFLFLKCAGNSFFPPKGLECQTDVFLPLGIFCHMKMLALRFMCVYTHLYMCIYVFIYLL